MIFRHRRLFTVSSFLILSVFLIQALPHAAKTVLLYVLLGTLFLAFLLGIWRRKIRSIALLLFLITLVTFSSFQVSQRREVLSSYDTQEGVFSVTVLAITHKGEESTVAEGRLTVLQGDGVLQARVKVSAPLSVTAGDVLYGEGRFTLNAVDSYDATQGLYGKILFSSCRVTDKVEHPEIVLGKMREALTDRIRAAFPDQNGELLCALLLGERDGLPADFTRDMSRIGTTHMLSLSGLHLMILTVGFEALLKPLRLGKRTRFLLLTVFSLFFMFLTGLSASVMRACFMFLLSALPFFLREERDSLSSLAAAVALICLFEPYACLDLSLWLSALSTLGILLFFDRQERKSEKQPRRRSFLLRYLILSLSVTLSATVATLPLTLCYFGVIPLLSPLANLVLSPLVQLALYLGAAIALLGNIAPLCRIASPVCNAIFTISRNLSDIPHTVLSVKEGPVRILVLSFCGWILAYFLLCPRKRFHFRIPISLLLCASLSVGATLGGARLFRGNDLILTLFSSEEPSADVLLLEYGSDTLLISCFATDIEGRAASDALYEAGGEIDALLLPTVHTDTPNALLSFLERYKVHRLYLPTPEAEDFALYEELLTAANVAAVPVVTYPKEGAFSFERLTVSEISLSPLPSTDPSTVFIELFYGKTNLQYYSANALRYDAYPQTLSADVLLFGAGGGPVLRLFEKDEYVKDGAVILCPSVSAFPFSDASGIVFAQRTRVAVPHK